MQEVCGLAVAYLEIDSVAVGAAVEDVHLLAVLEDGIRQDRSEKVYDSAGGSWCFLGEGEACSEG